MTAAVREEQVVGPLDPSVLYVVSPRGARVAWVSWTDGKASVFVDSQPGPRFDAILPAHDSLGFARRGEAADGSQFVIFSQNGDRYAYLAQAGGKRLLIVDGREIWREPLSAAPADAVWHLSFTGEAGRHVALFRRDAKSAELWIDGTLQPAMNPPGLVTNADGSRYAYATTQSGEPRLVIDGNVAEYFGEQPQFTANGRHVIAIGRSHDTQCVLSDGKPIYRARSIDRVIVAPGDRGIIFLVGDSTTEDETAAGASVDHAQMLVVNSTVVANLRGAHASIGKVLHSPDGHRYAAIGRSADAQFAIIDGEIGRRFNRIVPESLLFSPDSKHYAYIASKSDVWYLVTDGMLSVVPAGTRFVTFSPNGERLACGGDEVMADGEHLGLTGTLTFSPDNAHFVVAGRRNADGKVGLFVDRRLVYENSRGVLSWAFSGDGRHLYWLAREPDPNPASTVDDLVTYADGRTVDRTYMAHNVRDLLELNWRTRDTRYGRTSPMWDLGVQGEIVSLGTVSRQLRLSRIFSPADTSLATLVRAQNPGAAPSTGAVQIAGQFGENP